MSGTQGLTCNAHPLNSCLRLAGGASFVAFRSSNHDLRAAQIPTAKLSSGYDIPLLGMGTVAIKGDNGTAAVKAALKMGYRASFPYII